MLGSLLLTTNALDTIVARFSEKHVRCRGAGRIYLPVAAARSSAVFAGEHYDDIPRR
jgi:hypothetical protein